MNSQKMIATGSFTAQQRFSARQMGVYQRVSVGCVTEVAPSETRVALTPAACREIIANGHTVLFQSGAGLASGFSDDLYVQAGATILLKAEEVYQKSQVIVKVMQPVHQEYNFIQAHQVIFCFFDYTNQKSFLENMMRQKAIVINYQSLHTEIGSFPVLNAMSEIIGFLAIQQGMKLMETNMGSRGILLGQVSNVQAAHVLILGGGVAAVRAANFASQIGARVTLMDICSENLRNISQQLPSNVNTMFYTAESLEQILPSVDLMIGAVLPAFHQSPLLVSEKQMHLLQRGAVVIDLAIAQGKTFETSRLTSWEEPTFMWNNIVHFCVPNITLYTPNTSSTALSNVVLPYVLQVSNLGWKNASVENFELRQALAIVDGSLTNFELHNQTSIPFTPVESFLEREIQEATQQEQSHSATWSLKQQLWSLNRVQGTQTNTSFVVEA